MNKVTSQVRLLGLVAATSVLLNANADGPFTDVVNGIEWTYYTYRTGTSADAETYAHSAYITDKSAVPEHVVIPGTLGGLRLDSIGSRAFNGCTNLVSITIPPGIKSFGFEAFGWCSKLTAVNVESLKHWCGIAFSDWEYGYSRTNLGSNPLSTGAGLYTNGVLITDFVLPTNVFSIAGNAFYGYRSLKSVRLHDKIDTIAVGAFAYCANLESVVMGNGVRYVAGGMYSPGAFECCSSLTNLVFSPNLTYIGEHSFRGCGLKDITLPDSLVTMYSDCFSGCRSLTNVVFGNGLRDVRNGVFSQCGLTHVELPENLTSIPSYMFDDCRALKSVKFPKSIAFVGMSAFRNCNSISEVYIDDLESWCRIDFTWSDEYNNPYNPFTANPLVFGAELYVGGEPVRGALYIPDEVESIAPYAFYGWTNVTSVTFADGVARIDHEAFAECGVQVVRFGSGIEKMGYGAFAGCENLKEIDFGKMSADIDESVFSYCENLGDVTIPGRIGKIGDYAFGGCGLTNATICSGVKDVGSAFSGCCNLEHIAIPDSVTNLADYAFSMCEGLKYVVLGGGISKIPDGAFIYCLNLTNVMMSAGITQIGSEAFGWCSSLEELRIPGSVKYIGSGAFIGCMGLKSVEMGSAVAEIGEWAFAVLENLETMIFRGNAPVVIGEGVFECTNPDCVVRVPRNSTGWGVAIPGIWNGLRIEYIDAIAELPDVATDEEARAAVAEFADVRIAEHITTKSEYDAFREWARTVKGTGDSAGAEAVKASGTAWLSFALDADALVDKELTDEDITIKAFSAGADGGAKGTQAPLSLEFAIDGVSVGAAAIGDRIKTVLGVEGAEELKESAFSPDNLAVSLAPTDDGRVRATVTRRDDSGATGSSHDSFFLRVKVK